MIHSGIVYRTMDYFICMGIIFSSILCLQCDIQNNVSISLVCCTFLFDLISDLITWSMITETLIKCSMIFDNGFFSTFKMTAIWRRLVHQWTLSVVLKLHRKTHYNNSPFHRLGICISSQTLYIYFYFRKLVHVAVSCREWAVVAECKFCKWTRH